MKRLDVAVILTMASYAWLVTTVISGGLFYPNYSHVTQFMSELGATGSPHGTLVNYLGFLGTEILLLAALGVALVRLPKTFLNLIGFGFLLAYPLLISVSAFSPCDFECRPVNPTYSHAVHIAAGLLAYLCAVIGLTLLSRQSGSAAPSRRMKAASLVFLVVILFLVFGLSPENYFVGAFQRSAETLIYIWMIYWLSGLPGGRARLLSGRS